MPNTCKCDRPAITTDGTCLKCGRENPDGAPVETPAWAQETDAIDKLAVLTTHAGRSRRKPGTEIR